MNPNELVIGKRYLIFHCEWGKNHPTFWPKIYKYVGSNSDFSNVKEFEIVSDIHKSSIGVVVSFGCGGVIRGISPYSDDLFEYYSLFQT